MDLIKKIIQDTDLQIEQRQRIKAVLIIIFLAIGFYFAWFVIIPYYFPNQQENQLLWEGEITDKSMDFDVDHYNYYLEINGTIWKEIPQYAYDEYPLNTYVYYYLRIGQYYDLRDSILG